MNKNTPANAFTAANQPTPGNTRGKSPRTKALAALQRTMNWSEDELYDHIATEAFQNNNKDMLEQFLKTAVPTARTTLPPVQWQYNRNLPYHEKCEVVMEAIAAGDLPPDIGMEIITGIKHIATVREQTEMAVRMQELESALKALLNK
jgi:hypothetical protein